MYGFEMMDVLEIINKREAFHNVNSPKEFQVVSKEVIDDARNHFHGPFLRDVGMNMIKPSFILMYVDKNIFYRFFLQGLLFIN